MCTGLNRSLSALSIGAVLLSASPDVAGGQESVVPRDQPRKTLMQWSHGTSFKGGPPGADDPLAGDRPDFTETSTTVGLGVAQLEIGYTYVSDTQGGDSTVSHSYPEALLRVGVLAEWLEVRIGWNYAEQVEHSNGVRTVDAGSEDLYLGLKIALTPQEELLPEMVLIPQMTVPTGAAPFTAGELLPGLNWVYGWELDDLVSVAGSTQGNGAVDGQTGRRYLEIAQSFVAGYSLTERIGAYAEWFAFFPYSADAAKPEHYLDGGFTFLITDNLQLDLRGGLGLNQAAHDCFFGAGCVIRR